jgi:hypothetical protein
MLTDPFRSDRRLFRKAVQQGRSKRRGEEVRTALRVGRSPVEWNLANGKTPPVIPRSDGSNLHVEPLSAARTPLADFVNSLLARIIHEGSSRKRADAKRDGH